MTAVYLHFNDWDIKELYDKTSFQRVSFSSRRSFDVKLERCRDSKARRLVIMQGFVGFNIPIWVRRLLTMIPAIVVVVLAFNPTQMLIVSQVVLSFVLPLPVITLVMFTRRRDIMGTLVNRSLTTVAAIACSAADSRPQPLVARLRIRIALRLAPTG